MRGKSTSKAARIPFKLRQVDIILILLKGRIIAMRAKMENASGDEAAFYEKTISRFKEVAAVFELKKTKNATKKAVAVTLTADQYALVSGMRGYASLKLNTAPEEAAQEYPELAANGISHADLSAIGDLMEPLNPALKDTSQDAEEDEDESEEAEEEEQETGASSS